MQEIWVQSLGWEDPLEKETAIHSSILAGKTLWLEEPGRSQFMGSQRMGYDWHFHLTFGLLRWLSGKEFPCQCRGLKRLRFDGEVGKIPWSRKWQLIPVLLPGKFHSEATVHRVATSQTQLRTHTGPCWGPGRCTWNAGHSLDFNSHSYFGR